MTGSHNVAATAARVVLALGLFLFTAAPRPVHTAFGDADQQRRNVARATSLLQSNQPLKINAYYACLLNDREQGLSLAQAQNDCLAKLQQDQTKDSDDPLSVLGLGAKPFFDPSTIVADCSTGGGGVSYGYQQTPGWGGYSWGGNSNDYYGYDKATSQAKKEQAIQDAKAAEQRFKDAEAKADAADKAYDDAKKSGDAKKTEEAKQDKDKADKAAQGAASDAMQANEKAREDPNVKPLNNTRPVGGDSPCEQALEQAREILYECNRTAWKSPECRQLWARMNNCPDPTQIMVDPDQGYVCGQKIDTAALIAAWVAHCEQRKKFGPGDKPCQPPQMDPSGRFGRGIAGPICSDPQAYVLPGSRECYGIVNVQPIGQPDMHQLIVWALNKFGGPIIVLNRDPPGPRPGESGPGGPGGDASGPIGGPPWPAN